MTRTTLCKVALLIGLSLVGLGAQTKLDLRTQAKGIDFSAASSTAPFKAGTVLPTTCEIGEMFFKTDAPAGENVFGCTATNTWTLQGGSGSGGGALNDFHPSVASSTLTVLAGTARIGNQDYAIAQGSVQFTSGLGDCKTFVSEQGSLTTHCATGISGTPGGSMVFANVTTPAYPAGSIPVADLTITSGALALDSDDRAFISTKALQADTGISISESGGVANIGIDSTTVPTLGGTNSFTGEDDFSASTKFRVRTGTGTPSSATCDEATEVGGLYVRSDAQASNASHYVCSQTGTITYAWELTQIGGGGASSSQDLTDFKPTVSSGDLTVAAGVARIGNTSYPIAQGTVDYTAGSGDCKTFVADTGSLTTHCATGISGTPGGSMVFANITTPSYPDGSIPVADQTITSGSGALDSDDRSFLSNKSLQAGTGISLTNTSGVTDVAIDTAVVPQLGGSNDFTGANDFSATTVFRSQTGSGVPASTGCDASGEVGKIYIRNDAEAANASHYVCSKTGASTYAWELTQGGGGGSSPLTTKGDIHGYGSADARIPAGSNGQVLEVDSTEAEGVVWSYIKQEMYFHVGSIKTSTAYTGAGWLTESGGPAIGGTTEVYMAFDPNTDETARLYFMMPSTAVLSGGVDVKVYSRHRNVSGTTTILDIDVYCAPDDGATVGPTTNNGNGIPNGANNNWEITTISSISYGSCAAGQLWFFDVRRDADNVSDDVAGDFNLHGIAVVYSATIN